MPKTKKVQIIIQNLHKFQGMQRFNGIFSYTVLVHYNNGTKVNISRTFKKSPGYKGQLGWLIVANKAYVGWGSVPDFVSIFWCMYQSSSIKYDFEKLSIFQYKQQAKPSIKNKQWRYSIIT